MPVLTGLAKFSATSWPKLNGKIGYLCNSASVNSNFEHGLVSLKKLYGNQLRVVFSPQHGLFADEQDNMLESNHFYHQGFDLQVYSLYSEVRSPTMEMLSEIDHLIIDLQDVGTRVYTYIYTMLLTLEACGSAGVNVLILDRPNPINGTTIEGNILDPEFKSFIGLFPLPMRHGLTLGEIALMGSTFWNISCELEVIKMEGWNREMYFDQTGLPWVLPSPNLPDLETAIIYPGSVLFEGVNISEGRGTVRPLSTIGHPAIDPYPFADQLNKSFAIDRLKGFIVRPLYFKPTFNKYQDIVCGGFQVHITDRSLVQPWLVAQVLMREFYSELGSNFIWNSPPYEYEYEALPIDILNGTDQLRKWVENHGSQEELIAIELSGRDSFVDQRNSIILY